MALVLQLNFQKLLKKFLDILGDFKYTISNEMNVFPEVFDTF